ncbi:MAG TPA: PilZ domain-containing protein [Lacunisphaera sp.]|nr:PilZ domain-containing protein [Lacunisphaera sp.]
MQLFSHILDLEEGQFQEVERRRAQRYVPGRPFPLQATIEVGGEPRIAKIIDLSPGGAGLKVPGPAYLRGMTAKLHLMIADVWIEFPCRVAHVKAMAGGARVGLTALFDDPAAKKAFLQLLQPVAIGSVFRPVPTEDVRQAEPGLHKLVYYGRPGAELNVWCQDDSSGPPQSFLWQLDDYLVRGAVGVEELQVFSRKYMVVPSRKKPGPTFRKLPPKIRAEVRRLFHWTMLNLSKEVPADIRVFLQGFK